MGVNSFAINKNSSATVNARPFTTASTFCAPRPCVLPQRLHMIPSTASSAASYSVGEYQQQQSPGLVELLRGALSFINGSRQKPAAAERFVAAEDQLCLVSYADASSAHFKPMSAAARMAFAALEDEDDLEQQRLAAIGALCLVTYSEEDACTGCRHTPSAAVQAFSQLTGLMHQAEDDEDAGATSVMETLCIVSYDEE